MSGLTDKQLGSLETILLHVTGDTFQVLENIFGLNITSSDSSIELVTALDKGILEQLDNGVLYAVSSAIDGDYQGRMLVLLRSVDFIFLSRLMKPMLKSFYAVGSEDAATKRQSLQQQTVPVDNSDSAGLTGFNARMMEALSELGNMLCGVYTQAVYKVCALNSRHTVPAAIMGSYQSAIQLLFAQPETAREALLVIENEFFVMDNPIKLWCLIAPTDSSLATILHRLEQSKEAGTNAFSIARSAHPEN